MPRVFYLPGSGGDAISLDGEIAYIGTGEPLRSYKWDYSLTGHTASGFTMNARTATADLTATDAALDEFRMRAASDAANGTPGTLQVDGWSMGCYVVASSASHAYPDGWGAVEAKLLLLDGYWWKDIEQHFVVGLDTSGLDHDYDHDYDLSHSVGGGRVEVSTGLGAQPCVTFYGPCTKPYILVTGANGWSNRYEVDVSVLSGHKCVLDARGHRPTVMLYDEQGNGRSVFSSAVRGSGNNAFERMPKGPLQVSWSGSFAFTLAWREMETEPPWSR